MERVVLIVDDDHNSFDVLMHFFRDENYDIQYAPNGKLGYEVALEVLPDIMLLDWQMPEISGIEVVRKLAEQDSTARIPVIIMTGVMTDTTNLSMALESGAVDYLRKPLDELEVKARVRSALRIREQEQEIVDLLKENIKFKERELASKSMYAYQRDERLRLLLEQVQRLDRITSKVYATDIKPLERELKSQLNLEKGWMEFNKHFEKVHPGFFDKLLQICKSLTQNDCKLCAYIRMGMGNSEIAHFSNIARASVDRAFNRLKKKLRLNEEENLREFIHSLD